MTIEIPLTRGFTAIIDDCDTDLAALHWSAQVRSNDRTYALRNRPTGTVYMHRVILERILGRKLTNTEHVDHINNCSTDNRRSNLRVATQRQNLGNSRKHHNATNPYKGVHSSRSSKKNPWCAQIFLNGKLTHLGMSKTAEAAHLLYCLAAYAQWGVYANFGENSPFHYLLTEKMQALQANQQPFQLELPLFQEAA